MSPIMPEARRLNRKIQLSSGVCGGEKAISGISRNNTDLVHNEYFKLEIMGILALLNLLKGSTSITTEHHEPRAVIRSSSNEYLGQKVVYLTHLTLPV
jgi:hypothetical protein